MLLFKCPKCNVSINGFHPYICQCGYRIPFIDGVYKFAGYNTNLSINNNGLKSWGHENIFDNYDPEYLLLNKDDFGIFGSCARRLAEIISKDKIILDLSAGIGQASIPLAMTGFKIVASDVSQKMMSTIMKRAIKNHVPNDKIVCAQMNTYNLNLADSSIDVIIGFDVLRQIERPEFVMNEIKRVLKNDGILVRYRSKNFEYSSEQNIENIKYNEALDEIQNFYHKIIYRYEREYFSNIKNTSDFIQDNFDGPQIHESTEKISVLRNLEMGLHKLRTRQSGSEKIVAENVYDYAWKMTDEYARKKYGENYSDISRSFNMYGIVEVYRRR